MRLVPLKLRRYHEETMWLWTLTLIVFGHLQDGVRSDPISVADDGYVYTAGNGYHKIHSLAKRSDIARSICQEEGGDLAVINSFRESQVIIELFKQSSPHIGSRDSNYALVGFHERIVDVRYPINRVTNTEQAVHNVQCWNKPSVAKRDIEDCDAVDERGRLNPISCKEPYAFVCERPEEEICGEAVKMNVTVARELIIEGGEVNITCNVVGYPAWRVLWYKDDDLILTNDRINISEANQLIISRANRNDAGKYRCEAANRYKSGAHTVDIKVIVPVKVKIAVDDGPFSEGGEVSIVCNADGYPTPTVQWYKDDDHIQKNGRINIVGNKLIIFSAEKDDAGKYRCEATNEYTSSAETVDIKVTVPVWVEIAVDAGPFSNGSEISIVCNADGYPTPKVVWYKDDTRIETSNKIKISENELIISAADDNDTGRYRCEAANEYTSSAKSVDIEVSVPVRVKIAMGPGPYPKGSEITMFCNADGYPAPTIQWYKDGDQIQTNGRINIVGNKLIISRAGDGDVGKYRCEAANKYTSNADTMGLVWV